MKWEWEHNFPRKSSYTMNAISPRALALALGFEVKFKGEDTWETNIANKQIASTDIQGILLYPLTKYRGYSHACVTRLAELIRGQISGKMVRVSW